MRGNFAMDNCYMKKSTNMNTISRLAIWMDHSDAHVMEVNAEMKRRHIASHFGKDEKGETLARSEAVMHNKEHGHHIAFYKALGEIIKGYQEVLIFGPSNAKKELHNYLADDSHFDKIKFDVQSADYMTENEEHAFVRRHYAMD